MINLYPKTETTFTTNGLATLTPLSCVFSASINDVWKLELTLPYDGKHELIENDMFLKVTDLGAVTEQSSTQLFRIYDFKKQSDSMYVLAYPIGLDARFDTYTDSLSLHYKTASEAITIINALSNKYNVTTDLTSSASADYKNANIISILNGDDGFVQKWGGEICYDNYDIKVKNALGNSNSGVDVRYGKNLMSMTYDLDESNVITRLYPKSANGDVLNADSRYRLNANSYVDAANASDYPIPHIYYTDTPYRVTQLSDDGSAEYTASKEYYDEIKSRTITWLRNVLLDGGSSGALLDNEIELEWLVDVYDLTMIDDGTIGLVEYMWRKIISNTTTPITNGSVQSLIYQAMKDGFDAVLKDSDSEYYIGSSKKEWRELSVGGVSGNYYTYEWDDSADYADKNAWIQGSSKWYRTNENGVRSENGDTSRWKWFKAKGKTYKYYGTKKSKGLLSNGSYHMSDQWSKINGVWYWFDSTGKCKKGSALRTMYYPYFDTWGTSSIYSLLTSYCIAVEQTLVTLLYTQMTNYCTKMFNDEDLSYPVVNIDIDMVDLSKTSEYKDYQNLLKVHLGDSVKCINTKLGITTTERVIGVEYDVLRGFNSKISIGETESSMVNMLSNINKTDSTKYVGGQNVTVENNVIEVQFPPHIRDVRVDGESVVTGDVAEIDLDEIGGKGLEYFIETESALYGDQSYDIETVDTNFSFDVDNPYSIEMYSNNGYWTLKVEPQMDSQSLADNSRSFAAYCQWIQNVYEIIIPNIMYDSGGPNGVYLFSTDQHMLDNVKVGLRYQGEATFYSKLVSYTGSATEQKITIPTGRAYGNEPWYAVSSATVDGVTWYGMYVWKYNTTFSSCNKTKILNDNYPNPASVYSSFSAFISAVVGSFAGSETKDVISGMARPDKLAFFVGGDDEEGTNAPIKIWADGDYQGITKAVELTRSEYERLSSEEKAREDRVYFVNDSSGSWNAITGLNVTIPATDGITTILTTKTEIIGASEVILLTDGDYRESNQIHIVNVYGAGTVYNSYVPSGDQGYHTTIGFSVDFTTGVIKGNYHSGQWGYSRHLIGIWYR